MNENCENQEFNHDCSTLYDCCDCGDNECGCAYCWSCNACETCKNDDG